MLSRLIRKIKNILFPQNSKPEEVIKTDWNWIWQPFENSEKLKFDSLLKKSIPGIIEISPDDIPQNPIPLPLPSKLVIPLCAILFQDDIQLDHLSSLKNELEKVGLSKHEFKKDTNTFLEFRNKVFIKLNPKPRWIYFFDFLEPELQFELLSRFIKYRIPNQNDWRNIFEKIEYEFKKSIEYLGILIIVFLLSLLSTLEIFTIMVSHLSILLNILMTLFLAWAGALAGAIIVIRIMSMIYIFLALIGVGALVVIAIVEAELFSALIKIKVETFLVTMVWGGIFGYLVRLVSVTAQAVVVWLLFLGLVLGLGALFLSRFGIILNNSINSIVLASLIGFLSGAAGRKGVLACLVISFLAWVGYGALSWFPAVASLAAYWIKVIGSWPWIETVTWTRLVAVAIGFGLGIWYQAKEKKDLGWMRFFSILAFLWFCWFPIVFGFTSFVLYHRLSWGWQPISLFWLVVFGFCAALWVRGKKLEEKARNPLRGILDGQ